MNLSGDVYRNNEEQRKQYVVVEGVTALRVCGERSILDRGVLQNVNVIQPQRAIEHKQMSCGRRNSPVEAAVWVQQESR